MFAKVHISFICVLADLDWILCLFTVCASKATCPSKSVKHIHMLPVGHILNKLFCFYYPKWFTPSVVRYSFGIHLHNWRLWSRLLYTSDAGQKHAVYKAVDIQTIYKSEIQTWFKDFTSSPPFTSHKLPIIGSGLGPGGKFRYLYILSHVE